MRVTVKYMAQLKQAAGVSADLVEVSVPCSAADLLRRLAERYGDAFRRIVFAETDGIHPALLLFVGEEQVHADKPHAFQDGDVLTILAPMAGG
jgi:molybdopterin converting factor small subunit